MFSRGVSAELSSSTCPSIFKMVTAVQINAFEIPTELNTPVVIDATTCVGDIPFPEFIIEAVKTKFEEAQQLVASYGDHATSYDTTYLELLKALHEAQSYSVLKCYSDRVEVRNDQLRTKAAIEEVISTGHIGTNVVVHELNKVQEVAQPSTEPTQDVTTMESDAQQSLPRAKLPWTDPDVVPDVSQGLLQVSPELTELFKELESAEWIAEGDRIEVFNKYNEANMLSEIQDVLTIELKRLLKVLTLKYQQSRTSKEYKAQATTAVQEGTYDDTLDDIKDQIETMMDWSLLSWEKLVPFLHPKVLNRLAVTARAAFETIKSAVKN